MKPSYYVDRNFRTQNIAADPVDGKSTGEIVRYIYNMSMVPMVSRLYFVCCYAIHFAIIGFVSKTTSIALLHFTSYWY